LQLTVTRRFSIAGELRLGRGAGGPVQQAASKLQQQSTRHQGAAPASRAGARLIHGRGFSKLYNFFSKVKDFSFLCLAIEPIDFSVQVPTSSIKCVLCVGKSR
jgi:hypothetical protein